MAESRVKESADTTEDNGSAAREGCGVPGDGGNGSSADAAAAKLLAEYSSQMNDVKARAGVWQRHLEDYTALKETLATISDRVVHSSTMIPVGKKAYMEGTLVHTNEIMVLLGDNWFAERSAKQAGEVAERRIHKCTEMLESLDKELTLIEGWSQKVSDPEALPTAAAASGEVDIREPYDEEAEAAWAQKHKESVRRHKKEKSRDSINGDRDDHANSIDDELFRRLDELELEEELDEHLLRQQEEQQKEEQRQQKRSPDNVSSADTVDVNQKAGETSDADEENGENDDENEEDDWSESPPLSDEEEEPSEDEDANQVTDKSVVAAGVEALAQVGTSPPQYNTVPDVSNVRQSRFSVTEIISEKEVLTIDSSCRSVSQQQLSSQTSISSDKARRDHVAQLKPRKRRVSFGSISERLFMKDETTTAAAASLATVSASSREDEVYATVTTCGRGSSTTGQGAESKSPCSDVPTIFFSHHATVSEQTDVDSGGCRSVFLHACAGSTDCKVPQDPSDFVRLYGAGSPSKLKGILKPSGSSHSLSSFEEDTGTPTTLLGGRHVGFCLNLATFDTGGAIIWGPPNFTRTKLFIILI